MPPDTESNAPDPADPLNPFAGSLTHTESLTVVWRPQPALPGAADLAESNRRAAALLTLLGNLDEPTQPPEDDPQLAAHLLRLDQKADLLLNLVGQWLTRELALPAPQPVLLAVRGIVWRANEPAAVGWVDIYLRAGLPVALSLPAELTPLPTGDVLAQFQQLDAALTESLERYVFRCHRRAVAQARRPG